MAHSWTTDGPEVLLELDGLAPRSVRARLEAALREAIRGGRLSAGERLPSSRTLAVDLGVSRGLVVEVYSQLLAEGYLTALRGSGTRVASSAASAVPASPPPPRPAAPRFNFVPGLPDPASFPRQEWLRAMRRALAVAPDAAFGIPEPCGQATVRHELASYLARVRGVVADPERIVLCLGFSQAAGVSARALAAVGAGVIAAEDPGYPLQLEHLEGAGAGIARVAVDEHGLSVEALRASGADAVVVTPAHQFPTGVALAPERRAQLVAWAREGGWIIEDDYDAEFRYDGSAVGALQGLAPDRTIYVGTASKTLSPALRLGWMVVPDELMDGVVAAKTRADRGSPTLDQLALAQLIAHGAYDRHLRRMRRRYRARRDVLAAALARHLPEAEVGGLGAGLQLTVSLPPGVAEQRALRAAWSRGIWIAGLEGFRSRPDSRAALVLGWGQIADTAIDEGVRQLAEAIASVRQS